jgi:hypothetical protein
MKGHAEKRMTTIQLMRTMMPPSWTVRVMLEVKRKLLRNTIPRRARHPAGRMNANDWDASSGYGMRIRRGVTITPAERRRIIPTEERIAA